MRMSIKMSIFYIGGEDVRMRIPLLKSMIVKGYFTSAVGCDDSLSFIDSEIDYHNYHLSRGISPLQDFKSKSEVSIILRDNTPNLVHLFDTKPGVLVPKVAKQSGVKLVVRTVTGMGFIFSSNSIFVKILRPFYRFMQKRSIKYTDALIFQNPDDKKYFEEHDLVPAAKSYLVAGSGLDVDDFTARVSSQKTLNELKINFGFKETDIVVTLIARLVQDKGIEEFLQAAKIISDKLGVRFLLVGPRSGEGKQAVSAALVNSYSEYINYIGPVDNACDVLSISDVFVLPTYYREGLPRILLEAGALGLPLITTDMPGCRDVVRHGWNGLLVPVRDSAALALAIEKLIKNPDLRRTMGSRNPKFIKENFDLAIVTNAYDAIYKKLLSR